MQVKHIKLDKRELPDKLRVDLTIGEAAFITKVLGQLPPSKVREIEPLQGHSHLDGIWGGLTNVFNSFWQDGLDGFYHGDDE